MPKSTKNCTFRHIVILLIHQIYDSEFKAKLAQEQTLSSTRRENLPQVYHDHIQEHHIVSGTR